MPEQDPTTQKTHPLRKPWVWLVFFLALPMTLGTTAVLLFNYRAESAYRRHVADLRHIGETLIATELAPPEIPDHSNNFARAPIVRALIGAEDLEDDLTGESFKNLHLLRAESIPEWEFDASPKVKQPEVRYIRASPLVSKFRGLSEAEAAKAILAHCEPFERELSLFRKATERPDSNFERDYSLGFYDFIVPEGQSLQDMAKILRFQARAASISGNSKLAHQNALSLLSLARHISKEPTLIHQLISVVIAHRGADTVREGLVSHVWSKSQLEQLSNAVRQLDYQTNLLCAYRMERAMSTSYYLDAAYGDADWNEGATGWSRYIPTPPAGYFYENVVKSSQLFQEELLSDKSGTPLTDRLNIPSGLRSRVLSEIRNPIQRVRYSSSLNWLPAFDSILPRIVRVQVYLDQAAVAIELEKFRLDTGAFPKQLSALQGQIPKDLITGIYFEYSRYEDGSYQLYSPGLNLIDEGGLIQYHPEKGDWVWCLQLPEDFDYDAYRGR